MRLARPATGLTRACAVVGIADRIWQHDLANDTRELAVLDGRLTWLLGDIET
jgi:hypothetical protein